MRSKHDHARALRRNQTEAERHLWRFLRNRRLLGFKFRRQHPIGPYFADFACAERRLVVELDGSQHLTFAAEDVRRTRALQRLGYRVVRFWNDDALLRTAQVLDAIVAALHLPSPCVAPQRGPSPRKRGEGRSGAGERAHSRDE
jgi:very-short-patch-repair endonuclease